MANIIQPVSAIQADHRISAANVSIVGNDAAIRLDDMQDMCMQCERLPGNDHSLNDLVVKLRLANAHLVIATMHAQDLQAAAEATTARQGEFLAMLAHELRNPLAPVAIAAEVLGKVTDAHPILPKIHGVIVRQTSHMIRLIDDLLDASRINSGKITLQKRIVPLSEIIDTAIETSQPFIDKRQQHLVLECQDDPIPILIHGDLVRLTQVLSNLLINATKFTPEQGRIVIAVRRIAGIALISIKDNGIGIARDAQPFIFDLFTQGPQLLDRVQGGLGIGLSLARTIVQLHDGTITVHSDGVGSGSEFVVRLPVLPRPTLALDNDHT
jgi:two-component system, sensor histidine kinase